MNETVEESRLKIMENGESRLQEIKVKKVET